MQAFGIFEGGGAKGLAHVGAIAVAQELGVQFVGVAGASAGAIVAALIAVGYAPREVYDPPLRAGSSRAISPICSARVAGRTGSDLRRL